MENDLNISLNQICTKHNQSIMLYSTLNEPNCLVCMQQKTGMVSPEQYQENLNEMFNQGNRNYNTQKQLYYDYQNTIQNYKNSLLKSLDNLLQIIKNQINIIDSNQQKLQEKKRINIQQNIVQELQKDISNQQESNQQMKNKIKLLLEELQNKYQSSEELIAIFEKQSSIIVNKQISNLSKVQYEIIQGSNQLSQLCMAFAFNKENNVLIVACEKEIILYQFKNGIIGQELQKLTDHKENVNCLYFMRQSNQFVSGSYDNQIIIWEFDNDKSQWFAKQILKEYKNKGITCILMNKNEDLLISCSHDISIKFWKKINNSWSCQQTIRNIKDYQFDISLNEREDKLISCGMSCLITVMKKGLEDQWSIIQQINVGCSGFRLCFTIEDQFVYQPQNGDQLEIYSYHEGKNQFQILQKVQIQQQEDKYFHFPCLYIRQLKKVTVKHGKYLNIFKINQVGDYYLSQTVEFQSNYLFGKLTDLGQYLATWDGESKKIQVRKTNVFYYGQFYKNS